MKPGPRPHQMDNSQSATDRLWLWLNDKNDNNDNRGQRQLIFHFTKRIIIHSLKTFNVIE